MDLYTKKVSGFDLNCKNLELVRGFWLEDINKSIVSKKFWSEFA